MFVISEPFFNKFKNKEIIGEILFEKNKIGSLFFVPSLYLSIVGSGSKGSGTFVEIGNNITQICNYYEGYLIENQIRNLSVSGESCSKYLSSVLSERGYFFKPEFFEDLKILNKIKENHSFVSMNYQQDLKIFSENSNNSPKFKLPDGETIQLGDSVFRCMEPLFNPSLLGLEQNGIHQQINDSIVGCDIDLRKTLFSIKIIGCTSNCRNFGDRLKKELSLLKNSNVDLKITNLHKDSVWLGASILSGQSSYFQHYITNVDFEESGSNVLKKSFFY